MTQRTEEEKQQELSSLTQSHTQNETARDAFVGLGHTALFAASISFVGDVAPLKSATWIPALIMAWTSSVVGLLALALSFEIARKAIDARISAINETEAPASPALERVNRLSLWTFPLSLVLVFVFAAANVIGDNDEQPKTATTAGLRDVRCKPTATGAEHCESSNTEHRDRASSASAKSSTDAASAEPAPIK